MSALRLRGALTVVVAATFAAGCHDSTGPGTSSAYQLGQVQQVSESSVTLDGGSSGAEYLLVAFNGSQDSTSKFTANVTATNVTTPGTLADLGLGAGPTLSRTPATSFGAPAASADVGASFERMIRLRERTLASRIPGARAWYAQRTASPLLRRTTIAAAPAVGSIITLNASLDPCANPLDVGARVVAVTAKTIVVADTLNPAGGFTDAEYAAVGTTFDTLVDVVDEANFGAPTDIDGNGKVILFFTKEVNKLTPANSRGYVGGFFYGRDLFPTSDNAQLNIQGCPTSNVAEMFYLLVPDTAGTINNNVRTKDMVQQVTIGTTAHEYQHLINTGRRLYVNNAPDFEEVWLDEGLAHIAEELTFYREASLVPKQDIGPTALRTSQTRIDAFNNYQSANFGRFETYLESPSAYGPYQPNDSLETRGATWSLLRYLSDQSGANDVDTWHKLVADTKYSGLANLANAFRGSSTDIAGTLGLIRNWSVAVATDDLSANVDLKYQMPSWNFRDMYAVLLGSSTTPGRYPLVMNTLPAGSPQSVQLVASGSAYYRFAVAAGQQAKVTWSATNTKTTDANSLQVTVVRTK